MKTFQNIATVIRTGRESTGISQANLSLSLGYKNGQFISNVERGLCSIPEKKILCISKAINVPVKEIKDALMKDYSEQLDEAVNGIKNERKKL